MLSLLIYGKNKLLIYLLCKFLQCIRCMDISKRLTFEVPSATSRNNILGKPIKYADYSCTFKSVTWSKLLAIFFPIEATDKCLLPGSGWCSLWHKVGTKYVICGVKERSCHSTGVICCHKGVNAELRKHKSI